MFWIRCKAIIIFIFVFFLTGKAQQPYSDVDFRSPVDFTILLSGTFGELRSGHFHSGIDIKTGGVTGKNIYAIGDGWVSRIKVSAVGFGNAMYITHPEGYTSVYAHLQSFAEDIATFVLDEQYQRKSFAVDIPVAKGKFMVSKGDVIANSGNSGSSGGPHLHFEIRDAATQDIINPLHFGYKVKDFIRPKITGFMVYPESSFSLIDGKNTSRNYNVEGWGPVYRPVDDYKINVCGPFSIGVKAYDLLNDSHNKNGVYRYEMFVDGEMTFGWKADEFSFAETGYINSFIDYSNYVSGNGRYVRTAIDPNNQLSMYDGDNGIIDFHTPGEHTVKFLAIDFAKDTSALTMTFISKDSDVIPYVNEHESISDNEVVLKWRKSNHIKKEYLTLKTGPKSLFDNMTIVVRHSELPENINGYSKLVEAGNVRQVAHKRFEIQIPVTEGFDFNANKLCLARYQDGEVIYAGGKYSKGNVSTKTKRFGTYFITADTTAPEITPLNLSLRSKEGYARSLKFRITDNLSGITEYNGYFNEQWVLFRYDAKNKLLYYRHDKHLPEGNINLKLVVKDAKGNKSVFERTITN